MNEELPYLRATTLRSIEGGIGHYSIGLGSMKLILLYVGGCACRAIKTALGPKYAFSRPLLDLSKANWAKTIDKAFNKTLNPPFDPYANSLNYLISTYAIPYVGLTGYVGANPLLTGEGAKAVSLLISPIITALISFISEAACGPM